MPSPFPGMDPYLEAPGLWPDVHHGLISEIHGTLNSRLRPKYVSRVVLRMYISDDDDPGRAAMIADTQLRRLRRRTGRQGKSATTAPHTKRLIVPTLLDDEIKEARLEIRQAETGTLVTVIEVLSPTNKIRGSRGRASFIFKRRETLASGGHWVEIDFLRAGMPSSSRRGLQASDYRIFISRAEDRARWRSWPIGLRQPLPVIGIPLRGDDP